MNKATIGAARLVRELRRRGFELQPDPDRGRVRFRPAERMDPETLERLRALKPAVLKLLDPAHELSLSERVALGLVNPGWTPRAWRERLLYLAGRCERDHTDLAATYRTWAANIDPGNGATTQ